jgi:hypothetical protein
MQRSGLLIAFMASAALSACGDAPDRGGAAHHGGRFFGIGVYVPGALWQRQAGVARPADNAAATIADDEQIIVVVDSQTGEVRQCGNLSGHCITLNPWAGTPSGAPARLSAHAADLERETPIAVNVQTATPANSQ